MITVATRFWETISQPRYASAAAILAYSLAVVMGLILMATPQANLVLQFAPGGLLVLGGLIAAPSAWIGGRFWARRELAGMLGLAGGFLTGLIVEIYDLARTGDTATLWLEFLLVLVVVGAIVRAIWLRNRYWPSR